MSQKQLKPSEALRIFAAMQPEHGSYAEELRKIADEFDTLEAALAATREALEQAVSECPTCYGDGYVERPERVVGEADDPCPTCTPLRDALERAGGGGDPE